MQAMADQETVMPAPTDVFQSLAELLAASEWEKAAELYSLDVEVTNRFSPDGPTTNRGRKAVEGFFKGLGSQLDSLAVTDATLTPGGDPEMLTAEFDFSASSRGTAFKLPAIFVMRVRGGEIIESRDYIGPRRAA